MTDQSEAVNPVASDAQPTPGSNGGELLARIAKRCDAADIEHELKANLDGQPYLSIAFPSGRKTRPLGVLRDEDALALLSIPFERYRFIDGYDAIYSCEDDYVEAIIRPVGPGPASPRYSFQRLFGTPPRPDDDREWPPLIALSEGDGKTDATVTLGSSSLAGQTLLGRRQRVVALTLRGLGVKTHDKAKEQLEKYSNSLFFQIDSKLGLAVEIRRARRREPVRRARPQGDAKDLTFPNSVYDHEPMSLYWYARGATGMPLLQYLAYYQVIEFYFPLYAQEEVRRRLRHVVKDPAFSPHSDREIGRLVDVLSSAGGRNLWGDERSQLQATLHACVDAEAIRDLTARPEYAAHFARKIKGMASTVLRPSGHDEELVSQAAARIYEIRCQIVHTKGDNGASGRLLPFSTEAEELGPDIELVALASRRALSAAGHPIAAV